MRAGQKKKWSKIWLVDKKRDLTGKNNEKSGVRVCVCINKCVCECGSVCCEKREEKLKVEVKRSIFGFLPHTYNSLPKPTREILEREKIFIYFLVASEERKNNQNIGFVVCRRRFITNISA